MTPTELYEVKKWLRGRSWKNRLAWAGILVVDITGAVMMFRAAFGG